MEERSNKQKYTLEQYTALLWRIDSNNRETKKRLWWTEKDIGAKYDLMNDLGFNLCVVPWSLVVRLVAYFEVEGSC